jgi:exopolysaccharide biosynthesis predicted pyruvyltransferase EpsI
MDRQELDDSLNNSLCQLNAGEAGTADTPTTLSLASLSDQVSQIYHLQSVAGTKKEEELECLRHRVHYQEQLLQDKDKEIRKLEREQYRQQEERALELRSLIRRGNNPYHDEETAADCGFISSCFTAFLAALTSSSSTTNIRRRQGTTSTQAGSHPWKLLHFIHVAVIFILIFHFLQFPSNSYLLEREAVYSSTLPKHQQQQPSYDYSYQEPPTRKINPWDSQPPKPIALFDTKSPAVRQRHECIQAIRKRHVDILGPMITTTPKTTSTQDPPLLVDPAYHSNVGDHMLTLGEIEFLQQTMNLGVPLQCHYVQAGGFYRSCTEIISESSNNHQDRNNKYALWHAGGNWGDLWRDAQDVRIDSFKTLLQHDYTIIGMPQSLYYSAKYLQDVDVQEIKEKIVVGLGIVKEQLEQDWGGDDQFRGGGQDDRPKPINTTALDDPKIRELAHSRVTFTWREQESYDLAVQIYPFVKNVVVPDIAFQLGPYKEIRNDPKKQVDILVFLRNDIESKVTSMRNNEYVQGVLSSKTGKQLSSLVVDWPDRLGIFDTKDEFFTTTSIELLSLGKVVVCDRLHAAILCYLVGLPFVYIDQVSGKITKTLGVAFDGMEDCQDGEKSMWAKASSLDEALVKAAAFIDHYKLEPGGGFLSGLRNFAA